MTVQEKTPSFDIISDYVEYYAKERPGAEAMVLKDRSFDYRELNDMIDRGLKSLIAMGVKKGDRVATLSSPHPDFLILFLSCASIGAIWIGLNPKYTLSELGYVVGDAAPTLLFARTRIEDRDFRDELKELVRSNSSISDVIVLNGDPGIDGSICFDTFLDKGKMVSQSDVDERRNAVLPTDPALIVYTSGSTGKPKGALLPNKGLTHCSRIQIGYWPCDPVRLVNFLPINHIGCVGDLCCYALVAGGAIIFMEKYDPMESLRLLAEQNITCWGGVPTTIQMCVNLPNFDEYDLSSVQVIAWSGAAAPAELVTRLSRISNKLSNAYGMTETVGSVTFVELCNDVDVLANTVGKPVPEYDFRIADQTGKECPQGVEGEIQVRGDFVMIAYWNRPDATREAFTEDGYLKTGDTAVQRKDGNIKIVGRLSEMYKSGGYNVYPREIETALEEYPGVAMAAVFGVSDELYGETGRAYVLPQPGVLLDQNELKEHCRQRLANYKIPKKIVIEADLPMLPIGKIDKQSLRQRSD